jgi:hypothetical protein
MKACIAGLICMALIAAQARGQETKSELKNLPAWVKSNRGPPPSVPNSFSEYFKIPIGSTINSLEFTEENEVYHAIYVYERPSGEADIFLILRRAPNRNLAYMRTTVNGELVEAAYDKGNDFKSGWLTQAKPFYDKEKQYWLKKMQDAKPKPRDDPK